MSSKTETTSSSGAGGPPPIVRTTSAASHDTTGVVSAASSSQQTRFSFYNAEDFKIGSSPKQTKKSPKTPGNHQPPTTVPRYNYYNADEVKLTQTVMETVEAQHANDNGDVNNTSSNSNLDSVDILRSLQEHEQQRLDILAGPKRNFKNSSASNATHSCNNSHSTGTYGSGGMNFNSNNNVVNHSNSSNDAAGTENSNPYEEAIKEALQLIRKHRTPLISEPQTHTDSRNASVGSLAKGDRVKSDATLQEQELRNSSTDDMENNQIRLQQEFHELMIRTRSPPGTTTGPSSMSHGRADFENVTQDTPLSDAGLGDAYQAEIEARRKQRQERMARYASRLAELKQDDDDELPVVDTARSLDSSVDYGSFGIGRGDARQYHLWNGDREPGIALSRSWEEDAVVSARSQEGIGTYVAPISSNAGSVSTLSNTVRQDDEVQRGVERVLMAILERANSRGRTNVETNMFAPHNPAISEPLRIPVVGDEEKKSNDEKLQEDVLLMAMTDLLGPSTFVSGPTAPSTQEEEEDPSGSLATQEETNMALPVGAATSYPLGHSNNIPGSPSSGFRNDTKTNRSSQYAKDRRSRLKVANTNISSPPEEPIAPVDTLSSPNADDNDYDENESTHGSLEEGSVSDYNEDGVIDDRPDDDDDDCNETDDDSASSSDDDGSSSDDYDSNHETEHCKHEHKKYQGVLGPLSKRSGGTTGVVLEEYSSASSASYGDERTPALQPTSILESLSAAVSRVTGIAKTDDKELPGRTTKGDKYTMNDDESDEESSDSTDSEANELMRSLCAHLLPVGVDHSRHILDEVPEWDESNPDEAGYRIVRLTNFQLRGIQKEFDRMVDSLLRKSQLILSPKTGLDDSAFELDLRAAEELLDEEETKLKNAEYILTSSHSASSFLTSTTKTPTVVAAAAEIVTAKIVDESECLVAFPGVKPAGKGEMGELEYFSLPIIFKSHVTGFEPTKDIILEPGNVIAGQYLVEGVLGSAAFSTAYKCVDLNSEEDDEGCQDVVCLKVIKNTKDFFDQSLDEIKILELLRQTGKCNEKCIVEMRTFFYHREHLIIVTELLRQNLFEFGKFILDSGEEPYFTLPRLSYIARQCLIALDFVHGMGLVHSDVKPENILLASYSRAQAKLIDFGSSCYLTDRQSSYIQSRSYRAPEVVLGLPYDGRIDIWSLGCVIAEMFTGEVTFQNDSVVSMLSRIEAICGPFPRHMIAQGRQSARFFTKCGLLFEKVVHENSENTEQTNSCSGESSYDEDDGSHRRVHIDIFQPKRTTLAARMGFAPNLMDKFDNRMPLSPDEQRQVLFCDLVRKLLTIDPEIRLTAAEALNHPAMLYAATLTEADVKYPST